MDQYINEVSKLKNSKIKGKIVFTKKMKIKFLVALASHAMCRVNISRVLYKTKRARILLVDRVYFIDIDQYFLAN